MKDKNAPHSLRGIDENQEATPVALEDQPCLLELQLARHAEDDVLSTS
jgi:hypothetical protein